MKLNPLGNRKEKFQDVVNFTPVIAKIIDDEETLKKLEDSNFDVIISLLRKGPMTVKEITTAFNKEAKKSKTIESKSEKTIYRYLKALEEINIVVGAGQRVVIGKTATEKLYMRTARIFEKKYKYIDWMGKEGNEWAQRFGTLVCKMINSDKKPSAKCIQEFFAKWSVAKKAEMEKMATQAPGDVVDIITGCDLRELAEIIGRVYIFGTLMNQPDLLNQLHGCFQ
ncbi:MAG: hypothetical protein ACFFB2_02095 [Promethearchaeota archaeon]